MQAIDTAALDAIAARVLGVENPELIPFIAFSWDTRKAVKTPTKQTGGTGKREKPTQHVDVAPKMVVAERAHPVFRVESRQPSKNEKQQMRQAAIDELKAAYESNPNYEFEPDNYIAFATALAAGFRHLTKGETPLFLLDEDTLFQVENEDADCRNLRDLL